MFKIYITSHIHCAILFARRWWYPLAVVARVSRCAYERIVVRGANLSEPNVKSKRKSKRRANVETKLKVGIIYLAIFHHHHTTFNILCLFKTFTFLLLFSSSSKSSLSPFKIIFSPCSHTHIEIHLHTVRFQNTAIP